MLTLYDFIEARERLQTVTVKTKLIHSTVFSDESGNDVYIKPENLQRTGSFKLRGAYNKIAKLTKEEKARGVIASSAGNHAQVKRRQHRCIDHRFYDQQRLGPSWSYFYLLHKFTG